MMLLFLLLLHFCVPGCGWTLYQETDGTRVSIVVCNFVEEGNVKEAVYKTGTACDSCLPGLACIDSLCVL